RDISSMKTTTPAPIGIQVRPINEIPDTLGESPFEHFDASSTMIPVTAETGEALRTISPTTQTTLPSLRSAALLTSAVVNELTTASPDPTQNVKPPVTPAATTPTNAASLSTPDILLSTPITLLMPSTNVIADSIIPNTLA